MQVNSPGASAEVPHEDASDITYSVMSSDVGHNKKKLSLQPVVII